MKRGNSRHPEVERNKSEYLELSPFGLESGLHFSWKF
jgi:hypothetical protein